MLDIVSILVSKVGVDAKRTVCDLVGAKGLRIGHYAILASLAESGDTTQRDLGEHLRYDASDVVSFLDDLEARSWVSRRRDDADRRRNVVSMTESGREALQSMQTDARKLDTELLAPLTQLESTQLKTLLSRIHANRS